MLDAVRAAGLRSTVITFDPHPRTLRGNRVELLATPERRLELLADAGIDDVLVLAFDAELASLSPEAFVDSFLHPAGVEIVAEGDGFRFGRDRAGDLDLIARLGIEVRRVPLVDNISSSQHPAAARCGRRDQRRRAARAARRGLRRRRRSATAAAARSASRPPTSPCRRTCSCRRTASTRGRRSAIAPPSRSARTRTTAAPSGASRPTCSTTTATSTAKAIVVELWERLRDEAVFDSEAALVAAIADDVERTRAARRPSEPPVPQRRKGRKFSTPAGSSALWKHPSPASESVAGVRERPLPRVR